MHTLALNAAAALALTMAGACAAGSSAPGYTPQPVALFTSLPLLWNEAPDMAGLIAPGASAHWARAVLAAGGPVTPLDTLLGAERLRATARLMIAQPRPLSPEENVALDNWVRAGGKLLLLADPALTEDSAYAIGDQRRPQDVVMLSPILARWGLRLTIDDAQIRGERTVAVFGSPVAVNLPGAFVAVPQVGGGAQARCRIEAQGIAARCRIGRGTVVALADAALLERGAQGADHAAQIAALTALLAAAFR